MGFFARKQRGEDENHEDWAQLLLPWQQSFTMMTTTFAESNSYKAQRQFGLDSQTQQGPPGPKRAPRGSNWNALPTISRVGSTYVNNLFLFLRKHAKCIKPQFFYLIYRHLPGFTFQTITLSYVCLTVLCLFFNEIKKLLKKVFLSSVYLFANAWDKNKQNNLFRFYCNSNWNKSSHINYKTATLDRIHTQRVTEKFSKVLWVVMLALNLWMQWSWRRTLKEKWFHRPGSQLNLTWRGKRTTV